MIISADRILIQLIEHREIFLGIVDYVAQHDGSTEIPLGLYREMVRRAMASPLVVNAANPRAERRRLQDTFDLHNMQRSRLVIRVDQSRNMLTFAPFVLDMLRHFDASRLRGLSQTELEALRTDLNDSLTAITSSLDPDNFQEALRLLRRRISNTLAQVQESVAALQTQASHLSEQVEGQDMANLEEAVSIRKALSEINRIYQRYILPALEFLDPKTPLKGVPAVTAIRLIGDHFLTSEMPELATEMHLAAGAIQSYVNDIDAIRRSVVRRHVKLTPRRHGKLTPP
ncbi:hypothetical protein HBJ58_18580 [Halomonas desiderata]|uniref:hypothetical protein n=1 Tax=Billgrantia desiderata TaxID=52021 RepID=UPI00174EC03C|nr:hypothetical protein [Halomonas desiderata]